jgi:hypothetical protein
MFAFKNWAKKKPLKNKQATSELNLRAFIKGIKMTASPWLHLTYLQFA